MVPVFNEADKVRPLYEAVNGAMSMTDYAWEIVFIDDGNRDGTYKALEELHSEGGCVQIVRLRHNFGQTAGGSIMPGEIIVTLDGDLQNDPYDIPLLISKMAEGDDLVSRWRINGKIPLAAVLFQESRGRSERPCTSA